MKRVAEKQLTKDDEGGEDQEEVGTGFRKADASALSERKIRGLPKRAFGGGSTSTASAPQSSVNPTPHPVSRFGTFSGFGSGTNAPFSFTAPAAPATTSTSTETTKIAVMPTPTTVTTTELSTTSSAASGENNQEAAQKYCKALLGLNKSFVDAVNKAVETDPFLDISAMMQQYLTLRKAADEEFKIDTSQSSTTKFSSVFSFSNPPAATPSTSTSSNSTAPKPSFPFGTPQTGGSAFSFGSKPSESTSAPITSATGTNGASSQAVNKPAESTVKPVFGWKNPGPSTVPLTTGFSAFTSKPAGSGSTSPSLFSGVSGGSIGNPVGFGFGSQPSTPKTESAPSLFSKPSDARSAEEAKSAGDQAASSKPENDSVAPAEEAEAAPSIDSTNPYDEDGVGEEDETNAHKSKAKIMKMVERNGKAEWTNLGVGVLKLKVHRDGGKRLLMRNSSTGKVLVNCKLHPGMKANLQAKAFTFRVPGDGENSGLRLFRVKTAADAQEWIDVIAKEVESLDSQ